LPAGAPFVSTEVFTVNLPNLASILNCTRDRLPDRNVRGHSVRIGVSQMVLSTCFGLIAGMSLLMLLDLAGFGPSVLFSLASPVFMSALERYSFAPCPMPGICLCALPLRDLRLKNLTGRSVVVLRCRVVAGFVLGPGDDR
jgi:hypothetical protein